MRRRTRGHLRWLGSNSHADMVRLRRGSWGWEEGGEEKVVLVSHLCAHLFVAVALLHLNWVSHLCAHLFVAVALLHLNWVSHLC